MPTNLAAYAVTQVPQRHIAGHDPAEITSRHMEMSQRDYQIQAEQNNLGLDWKVGAWLNCDIAVLQTSARKILIATKAQIIA